ncbi:hypothetical protein Trydic_g1070 [Trypoxylus dichotomus]
MRTAITVKEAHLASVLHKNLCEEEKRITCRRCETPAVYFLRRIDRFRVAWGAPIVLKILPLLWEHQIRSDRGPPVIPSPPRFRNSDRRTWEFSGFDLHMPRSSGIFSKSIP